MTLPIPLVLPDASSDVDVVAMGENSLDVVGVMDGWPSPGVKQTLASFARLPGGQASTAALACRRLGWRSRYVGAVGDDADGRRTLSPLREAGVDVQVTIKAGARSRRAIVLVDRAARTRTVLEHRDPALRLRPEDVPEALVTTGRLLLVDATDLDASTRAARLARHARMPVVADVEGPAAGLDVLLAEVDVLVVGEGALTALTGEAEPGAGLAALERAHPARVLAVTLGGRGSLARCRNRELSTPAPRVEVVDTTGAGDAFRAGLMAGWLRWGDGADLADVLAYANRVAALSCRGAGAQGGLPAAADVERFFDPSGR